MTAPVDFRSALYLGLRHGSRQLPDWQSLTTGYPAALEPVPGSWELSQGVARLQGLEAGLLGSSTLHLYVDLLGRLAESAPRFLIDAGSYPVAKWALSMVRARPTTVSVFPHRHLGALTSMLAAHRGRRPVVLVDDFCVGCGRVTNLRQVAELVAFYRGILIVDTTQGLGVFGKGPSPECPLGRGGGGVLATQRVDRRGVVTVASLAKAFGCPAAVVCGPAALVELLRNRGSQMHSSPPPAPVVSAGLTALRVNAVSGDARRAKLVRLVWQLKARLHAVGLAPFGGCFPLQVLPGMTEQGTLSLNRHLSDSGFEALPLRTHRGGNIGTAFAVTTEHTESDIARLARAVTDWHRPRLGELLAGSLSERSVWRHAPDSPNQRH